MFSPFMLSVRAGRTTGSEETYRTPRQPTCQPGPPYVVEALLVALLPLRCYRVIVRGADGHFSPALGLVQANLSWSVVEHRLGTIVPEGQGHSSPPVRL